MIVSCDWCGKELKRIPAKVNTRNFCSYEHTHLWRRGRSFLTDDGRERLRRAATGKVPPHLSALCAKQHGPNSPTWKGDALLPESGRARARAYFPLQPCEVCGAMPETTKIYRHHRDTDPRHNTQDNIAFLCPKHHMAAHGGTWRQKRLKESEPCLQSGV